MTEWWVVNVSWLKIVSKETCPGNAAELKMVLEEMNPDTRFIIKEVKMSNRHMPLLDVLKEAD